MPISAYPTPELGGPKWLKYTPVEPSYDDVTGIHTYQDEGISTYTNADTPKYIWILEYDGLYPLEAEILDDHYDEAFGQANSFTFTDREGVAHTGVRYDKGGFKRSHDKQAIQKRSIRLVLYP